MVSFFAFSLSSSTDGRPCDGATAVDIALPRKKTSGEASSPRLDSFGMRAVRSGVSTAAMVVRKCGERKRRSPLGEAQKNGKMDPGANCENVFNASCRCNKQEKGPERDQLETSDDLPRNQKNRYLRIMNFEGVEKNVGK